MSINEKDIKSWIESGIINEQQAAQIAQLEKANNSNHKSYFNSIIAIIGALLVGLGIILLIAHNWDDLPKWIRIILAFLPYAPAAIAAWLYLGKNPTPARRESAGILSWLAIGANISLISQIYHINGELKDFILQWILFGLPLLWLIRGFALPNLLLAFNTILLISGTFSSSPFVPFLLFTLVAIGYLFAYRSPLAKNPSAWLFTYNIFYISLIISIPYAIEFFAPIKLLMGSMRWNFMAASCAYMMLGIIAVTVSKHPSNPLKNLKYPILEWMGYLTLLIIYLFLLNGEIWNEQENQERFKDKSIPFLSFIPFLFLWIMGILLSIKSKFPHFQKLFLILPWLLIFTYTTAPWVGATFANLSLFIWAALVMFDGYSKKVVASINFGMLLMLYLIAYRFFDSNINFTIKGIIFILMGILFFFINHTLRKSWKNND